MDLGALKGPAELILSRTKAFKNCLDLATECLTNKDYLNAEMIYGGILADLHKNCVAETLGLNDLEIFSLHSCFAYSSIGADYKTDQALVILNSIDKPIKLPLVPYLKAFVHISNDRISFAYDELESCQTLLEDGYNFKPNAILNENVVPEINDQFLKLKMNGLKFACELLKTKGDDEDLKKSFKENWLKIGVVCEPDFAKLLAKEEENDSNVDELVKSEKKQKKKLEKQTGAIKKTEKVAKTTQEISTQTIQVKTINIGVQTIEKDLDKQVLSAILEIKNKINNLQGKKDSELKQLSKKNLDLYEKLTSRENKREEQSAEFNFLKEQYLSLEKKYEQSQKMVDVLQKLLIEQLQQKYNVQKTIFQLFEEKCDFKIVYLSDIQKILHPADRPTPEECKQEVALWRNTLGKINSAKQDFETYYRAVNDLIVAKKFSSIKTGWPSIPFIPNDQQDLIYRNFKIIMQQSKNLYNSMPPSFTVPLQYNVYKEHEQSPNPLVNGYGNHKEDGRTTGSPNCHVKSNPNKSKQKTSTTNQNCLPSSSSPTSSNLSNKFKLEQDLLKFLQIYFQEVGEIELLEALCHVRDNVACGSVIEMPRRIIIEEIKKFLKKSSNTSRMGWNSVKKTEWRNDHSDNKCVICFENFESTTSHSLPCQHEFHKKCITNWLKRQSACPVCRVYAVIDDEFPPL